MNQIFRINVGPETVQGRLPAVRVGLDFGCRFHIAGVAHVADVPAPKIWITRKESSTVYWTATWDETLGLWVATIGSDASAEVGTYVYALTMYAEDGVTEFIAGQGAFAVYPTIAYTDGSATGDNGTSVWDLITALEGRLEAIETRFTAFAELGMFDAEQAFDIDMRNQVAAITTLLRGTQP